VFRRGWARRALAGPPREQMAIMSRNLVLCCDGTSNEFSENNTNVVKLYQMLESDPARQFRFYDPGVGTFALSSALLPISKRVTRILGLAIGLGLIANVEDAYRFLMNTWIPGDKIFIFGFSRGAYAARTIAAMIHRCGLLPRDQDHLVPYVSKAFADTSKKSWKLAARLKKTFAREARVHFLGLWDTVSSVGWAWSPRTYPFTADNPSVETVRHALAIDEKRAFFRQNSWWGKGDVKEVWFAGVHSDVGGSWPPAGSGLSQIALEWMVREAEQAGLLIDARERDRVFESMPDHKARQHKSLKWYWWPAEFFPKVTQLKMGETYYPAIRLNLFRRRFIPEGSVIHRSVADRMRDLPEYKPMNLPDRYTLSTDPHQ
jgi:uncharacterized protein (DUF2235 family)